MQSKCGIFTVTSLLSSNLKIFDVLAQPEKSDEDKDEALALVDITKKALQVRDKDPQPLIKGTAKSGVEFFASRSFQGLDIHNKTTLPEPFLIGRSGRAAGYKDETCEK